MSLRTQLILVLAAVSLIPLAVVSWAGIRYMRSDKEAFLFALGSETAPAVAEQVSANLGRVADRLRSIAVVAGAARTPQERIDQARRLFEGGDLLAAAVWSDGSEWVRLTDDAALPRGPDRQIVLDSLARPSALPEPGGIAVSNATRLTTAPVVRVTVHHPGKGTSPALVAVALVPAHAVLRLSPAATYRTYLVDGSGTVIVHPDPERMAAKADLGALSPVQALSEGSTGSKRYPDLDGVEVLGSFAPTRIGGLGVVQEIAAAEVFGAVRALFTNIAAVLVGVLVLVAIGAVLVGRGISRPVTQLAQAARAMGDGALDAEVPLIRGGEMGELAEAFRAMQRGLAERDAHLEEAREALVHSEKMGALGQLAAGISHEVKNPMAAIIGFAQLSQKLAPADSTLGGHLEVIVKESRRAKEILDNLLRFARRELVEMTPVQPESVVQATCRLVAHQLKLEKVELVQRIEEGLPPVLGNATQLEQVLMNLVMNGAHAMRPKGGRLEVAAYRDDGGQVVLEIKDEGHGIKEEDRKKLFTPFFTTKARGQGTGLGLSVSYGIVEQHGGQIRVWSQEGVGTIFYVYLPAVSTPSSSTAGAA